MSIIEKAFVVGSALVVSAVVAAGLGTDRDAHAATTSAAPAEVSRSVAERPCFGAPARAPIAPCSDPSLRRTVFPSPDDAPLESNSPCKPRGRTSLLYPCSFGASAGTTDETALLIGDSHASHWRAAVDVVARARGRAALSITRSGCSFIKAQAIIPAEQVQSCGRWNREALAWIGRHREVTTMFVSTRAHATYVQDRRGASSFETAVRGHLALWRALPATVKSIFVIRDTPYSSTAAVECVRRAYARKQLAQFICARERARALHRDPAVTAARRLRSPRVHVLDMTSFFCDGDRCYPVVGGALVHKDTEHITATFARTLGPFMLAMVDKIVSRRLSS